MPLSRFVCAAAFAAAVFGLVPPPDSHAETLVPPPTVAVFDAAGATALAETLVANVSALRGNQRVLPAKAGALQSAQAAFEHDLQLLETNAQLLAGKLASGASEAETYPLVRRVRTLSRDAKQNARRANVAETELALVNTTLQLVAGFEPFYGSSSLPASPATP